MKKDELYCVILAKALFPLLKLTEGVAVHLDGKGYIVSKKFDEEFNEVRVSISRDDDMLYEDDLTLLWIHDEPIGNA